MHWREINNIIRLSNTFVRSSFRNKFILIIIARRYCIMYDSIVCILFALEMPWKFLFPIGVMIKLWVNNHGISRE